MSGVILSCKGAKKCTCLFLMQLKLPSHDIWNAFHLNSMTHSSPQLKTTDNGDYFTCPTHGNHVAKQAFSALYLCCSLAVNTRFYNNNYEKEFIR